MVFIDSDPADGWIYTNDNTVEVINKQIMNQPKNPASKGFSYAPYFLIYIDVTLEDGTIIITSKLPIYYK